MNYGKRSTSKKRNALISRTSMLEKRAHVSFIRVLFTALIAVCVMVVCLGIGSFRGVIAGAPDVNDVDISPLGYATFLYDDQGTQIRQLSAPTSNRLPVSLDQIPVSLQHAVVAIEDERFYEHNGIDVRGIARAGMKAITTGNFSEGASTITQQLLKNNVFTDWTNESTQLERFTRKFQEQYLAVQIEKKYDKNVILENYLNTINLGAGSYGVQAASKKYFNKDVWDLNLSECATLAGITQNPTKFNPITNPKANSKRRKEVLDHMLDQNYISQDEYNAALNDDVYSRIQAAQLENTEEESTVYTYFEDEVTNQVISDLMNIKGYTKTQATNLLYSGGLKIMTTLDSNMQQILDEEYANPDNYPANVQYELDYALTVQSPDGKQTNYSKEMLQLYFRDQDPEFDLLFDSPEEGQQYVDQYKANILADGSTVVSERVNFAPQPQSSMTVIDQHTGYVKALIGGRGEKTASLTLNRATDTTRQPGSTFKILAAYSAALDAGGLTLASVQDDAPYTYAGANGKSVNNYDRRYRGFTTLREAITDSINIVTVKTLAQAGVSLGWQYVQEYGFTTVDSRDMNEALALGGITQGVSNLELTAAYAAIANQGTYIKPKFYTKILDHDGNVLIDNTTPESHTVIKDTTAWLLTSAMEDVMTSGTGTSAYFGSSMAQAGKSGTTTSSRDALFAGYTPYYTCAVWGGYDDNAMQKGSDTNYPKRIWKAVMKRIHENLAYKDFTKPSGIVAVAVCKESGKLPIEGVCDHDPRGNCVITEYFAQGTEPTEYCDHHTVANICTASNMLAGSYCPAETVTTGVYVTGGSETTEDAPYLLTDAFLSQTCTVHNEFNSTYTGTNSFPGSTGVNPIGADPAGDAATPDASTTTTNPNTTTDPAATTDQSVDGQ